jgi:hypothetical protein
MACSITAPHRISTLIPEYPRCVDALRGIASGALIAAVPPGLHSWNTAGLQLGDDLVGDFGVKARAVIAGTNSGGVSGHRGSPRRAPEASPPIFQPVAADPASSLTLKGGDGGTDCAFARLSF